MPGKVEKTAEEKHFGDVTSILCYKRHVFSAGADGKLKVFDENLKQLREIQLHEAHIYAIVIDRNSGKLYSSSCDSTIKVMPNPLESDETLCMLSSPDYEIESLFVDSNSGRLFAGDDHGGVTLFEKGKLKFKINIVEAVHGLIVENNYVYTIRNLDLSIHEFNEDTGKYLMKGQVVGKNPICLCGNLVNGKREFIVVPTRCGKGLQVTKNSSSERFRTIYSTKNAHEMIINGACGTEKYIFTCCYAGQVKRWNLDLSLAGDVCVGICANTLAVLDDNTVFVGFTDGSIRKITF